MSRRLEVLALVRNTEREFRRIKRTRGLTRRDKQELQRFFIEHIFAPESERIFRASDNGAAARPRMLTAKELEAWLQVDRKTIYAYVVRKAIPHIRIEGNVRFVESDIRRWLERRHVRGTRRRKSK